ncbi:DsbE family thiol:disulfide interchange protein [Cellvibrio sp. KY-GH-1]|uniref:DsbE family thiol:disulfide interchange protein n=1 Tax=Cellvibrio sp. KY-GH-1 TaxID=2303332 RepID=UPI0012449146|nr:DsbE family thiol:disulfide interchange protein [Cellvibrio sp. KY-GH-1]QEY15008.1 DsbE family thiol:disulfide interchange protein [Cellvibrio sp. KY-GH-1]
MNKQRLLLFIPLVIFAVLVVLFWRGLSLDPSEMPSALLDKPVPNFELAVVPAEENPAGLSKANQEMVRGKAGLLNVWATWCLPCKQEHPYLNILKSQGVPIYGVNYKDNAEDAQRWLAELHNPYVFSVLDDDGRLALNLGVFGYPETYVIDKQGVIRYKHIGIVNEKNWNETIKPIYESLK